MHNQKTAPVPPVVDLFELTPMQHGMLFESALSDRPWINLEQIVIRMDEALDPESFRQAWRLVQGRHAALRTSFRWQGLTLPMQEVHADAPLRYVVDDWRNLSTTRQESELRSFIEADREAGVSLDEPAPMRIRLFRCGDSSWTMVWTFHHAILDGRGFTLVLEEVFRTYEQTQRGEPLSLLPGPTMRPHVEALRERDSDAAEAFFRELLTGCESTHLPMERSSAGELRQREFTDSVSADVIHGLERLGVETNATLYACLQAGWAIALASYSGAGDVVFGSTRSGRHTFPEAKDTVGCFINTLPVRAQLGDEDSVGDLVKDLRKQSVDLRQHEHTPLVDIQSWCGNAGEALLSSNIVFERYYLDARLRANGGAWEGRHTTLIEQGSIPLTLALYLGDDGLEVRFEYDSSVYDEASIRQLCRHFSFVLAQLAVAESTTPISTISLLDDSERQQLLAFGRPSNPIQRDGTTYLDVFDAQVRRAPRDIALRSVDSDETCTYEELDRKSNHLAHRLRAQGVEPGERVAVCLPRSFDLATALLAVLKTGAAYVPLDPSYPSSALSHMLEDSGAKVALTHRCTDHALIFEARDTLFIDEVSPNENALQNERPALSLSDSDAAYVIYTSGSTGTPKGVVVSHGALVAHNRAIASLFELAPEDRCLQFASLSFDVAVEEILSTWLAGATLVLRSQAMSESVSEFLNETERAAVTVLNLPTAFWHELVIQMDRRSLTLPTRVRLVIVGGEKASRKARVRWSE
ncbi:MAG: non-ribosomal peptide synthetase component F, partial [Polyangiales bacterium]